MKSNEIFFDIPINISVYATTEAKAEQRVFDFLKAASKEYGTQFQIFDWEYFQFIDDEGDDVGCSNLRCGNNDTQ